MDFIEQIFGLSPDRGSWAFEIRLGLYLLYNVVPARARKAVAALKNQWLAAGPLITCLWDRV